MERNEIQGNTGGGSQASARRSRGCVRGFSLPVKEISTPYKEGVAEGVIVRGGLERYKIKGFFGSEGVWRTHDSESDIPVAVKGIYIPGKEGDESTINEEITLFRKMTHPNIVRLLNVVRVENTVNLIFEDTDLDLEMFMNAEPLVKPHQIKVFLYQILRGIACCHSHNFIHGNLKPQNLLIKRGGNELMIAVFGAATATEILQNSNNFFYTGPELLIGSGFSPGYDIWSVGCVFAEMVIQKPLFEASNFIDVFDKIFSIVGSPTEERWPGVTSFCVMPPRFCNHEPKNLADFVPGLEDAGIDLLTRMLCLNPSGRITASQALQHEYFNGVEHFL